MWFRKRSLGIEWTVEPDKDSKRTIEHREQWLKQIAQPGMKRLRNQLKFLLGVFIDDVNFN